MIRKVLQSKSIKRSAIIASVVVLLGLGVMGTWAWTYYQMVPSDVTKEDDTSEYNARKEEQSLKKAAESASSNTNKAKAYTKLSNFYANQHEAGDESVDYAKKAVEADPTVETYAQLAFAAEQAGDVQKAIEAYEKAASLSEKTALDDGRSDYSYYMMQARLLRESQQ